MFALSSFRCLLISTCLIVGCGYVSTSSYLEHIKTIRIASVQIEDADITYDTRSDRPYDEVLQEKLIERFTRKWRNGNDAELELTIMDYDLRPIEYGPTNEPEEFRMSLQVDYKFTDRVQNKIINQNDSYFQVYDFYVVSGRDEEPKTREQAQAKIMQELVDDLFSLLAEQW